MQALILVIHVLAAVCLVILVLMQHGKGADMGAAFGSGASNTMFGSAGATPFLMKVTMILTAVFFVTSISLSFIVSRQASHMTMPTPVPSMPANPTNIPPSTPQ